MTTTPITNSAAVVPPVGGSVRAFAPGGIGNMGPGLDILGCAVTGAGDRVRVTVATGRDIRIGEAGHPDLPRDPERHTAGIAARQVFRRAGVESVGIVIDVEKGLPLAGGQGGSAASAVAAAVATNALLGAPLGTDALIACALVAEERVSGRQLDNIAPVLLGGILLIRSVDPLDLIRLPVPPSLRVVIVQPNQHLRTRDARAVLPAMVDRATALAQAASVASMVAAFFANDLDLLARALDDRIAEPVRALLVPGFAQAKAAAMAAGAKGCSISGAGPAAFAFAADDDASGARIGAAMCAAYEGLGIAATARIAQIDQRGARVEQQTPAGR